MLSILRPATRSAAKFGAGKAYYACANSYLEYHLPTLRADSFYDSTVEKYAALEPEVLSLGQMLEFGKQAYTDEEKLIKSARYVHRELPIRLARRLLDLQLLPYIVVTNPHIKRVYNQYYISFETIRRFPTIKDKQGNHEFTQLLRQHLDQHAPMLESLATGLRECKSKDLVGMCLQMDAFFDTMISSRVTRRVLAEQHLHFNTRRPGYAGVICLGLDVQETLLFAIQKARQVCMETYGAAPDVRITGDGIGSMTSGSSTTSYTSYLSGGGCGGGRGGGATGGLKIPYIPAHIDYMLYELLKNSMRAVVEHHLTRGSTSAMSPIQVLICNGASDLTFRIADEGGGIHPSIVDRVWSYGFTTSGANDSSTNDSPSGSESDLRRRPTTGDDGLEYLDHAHPHRTPHHRHPPPSPSHSPPLPADGKGGKGARHVPEALRCRMAGLGFGLPLSRLYARYFGGDLKLQPIPGFGTDAYLTLKKLNFDCDFDWKETAVGPSMLPLKTPAQ